MNRPTLLHRKGADFLTWLNVLHYRGIEVYGTAFEMHHYPRKTLYQLYVYSWGTTDMITFIGLHPCKGILLTNTLEDCNLLYLLKPFFPLPKQFPSRSVQEVRSFMSKGCTLIPDPLTAPIYCLDGLGTEVELYLPKTNDEYFKNLLQQRYCNRLLTHATSSMPLSDLRKKYGGVLEQLFNVL